MSFSTHQSRLQLACETEDGDVLRSLAADSDPEVRVAAVSRMTDRIDLAAVAAKDRITPVVRAAQRRLSEVLGSVTVS